MTNEEYLEELLWEAHKKGNNVEVMQLANTLTLENPKLTFLESVYKAVQILNEETEVTI